MRAMRSNGRRILRWAALAAFVLLAVSAVPHPHDEVEGQGEHCVLCHALDAPLIASGLPANPHPAVCVDAVAVAVAPVSGMTPTGGGSRAPPA